MTKRTKEQLQTELGELQAAVATMADKLIEMDTGDIFDVHFTCLEMEAVLEVLRIGGHDWTARTLVMWHARGDYENEDMHHNLYEAIRQETTCERHGGTWGEDPACTQCTTNFGQSKSVPW